MVIQLYASQLYKLKPYSSEAGFCHLAPVRSSLTGTGAVVFVALLSMLTLFLDQAGFEP